MLICPAVVCSSATLLSWLLIGFSSAPGAGAAEVVSAAVVVLVSVAAAVVAAVSPAAAAASEPSCAQAPNASIRTPNRSDLKLCLPPLVATAANPSTSEKPKRRTQNPECRRKKRDVANAVLFLFLHSGFW